MTQWRMSKPVKSRCLTDLFLVTVVLVLMANLLTGMTVHEWLGVLLAGALIIHLLLNWTWLRVAVGGFRGPLPHEMRLNAVLDAAFFVAMVGALLSGLLVSQVLLPAVGIVPGPDPRLRWLHSFAADVMLVVLGLHLGMHWPWISRILGNLLRRAGSLPAPGR